MNLEIESYAVSPENFSTFDIVNAGKKIFFKRAMIGLMILRSSN